MRDAADYEVKKLDVDVLEKDIASGVLKGLVGATGTGRPVLYVADPSGEYQAEKTAAAGQCLYCFNIGGVKICVPC